MTAEFNPDEFEAAAARATAEAERMLAAARPHIMLVAPDGVWWSDRKAGPPVQSVGELANYVNRIFDAKYLQPTGWFTDYVDEKGKERKKFVGEPPQVWVMGEELLTRLGWWNDREQGDAETDAAFVDRTRTEFAEQVTATLDPFLGSGWEILGRPGYYIQLKRQIAKMQWYRINLVIDAMAWLPIADDERMEYGIVGVAGKAGSELPDDDTDARVELTRRLAWSIEHLATLPSQVPSSTGATVLDMEIARKKRRDDIIGQPTPLPVLRGMAESDAEPEPTQKWTINYVPISMLGTAGRGDVDGILEIDQTASFLASAGAINVGYGKQFFLEGDAAVAAVLDREDKAAPAGLYQVTLPAGRELVITKGIPDARVRDLDSEDPGAGGAYLPWPHPRMRDDEPVTTWVTGPSLDLLREPVDLGGAGLDLDELGLEAAHVWEHETRMLMGWQKRLAKARKTAVETGDVAMEDYIKSIYRGYIGRQKYQRNWDFEPKRHHHQPILRASIIAHARNRGRRWAARLGAEYGRWPLYTDTDSWFYPFYDDEILWGETWATRLDHPEPLRASGRTGAFVVKRYARTADMDSEHIAALLNATTSRGVSEALALILPKPADDDEEEPELEVNS